MEPSALSLGLGGLIGLILALTGAGGGILAVPLLVFGMHLSMVQAAPVGLIAVCAASTLGALLGLREGVVRYRAAAVVGLVGMALAPIGVRLAQVVPNTPLTLAFSVVLVLVSWRMFMQARQAAQPGPSALPAHWPCVLNPASGRLIWTLPCAWALACTGAVAGLLSGLLGVGGGFVIIPSLTHFTNLATRSIMATSLAVMALVSVGGVAASAAHGNIAWGIALPFAAGAVGALLLGRVIAARLAGPRLQQVFAVTSGAVALLMLARGLGWLSS